MDLEGIRLRRGWLLAAVELACLRSLEQAFS